MESQINIKRLSTRDTDFEGQVERLMSRLEADDAGVFGVVSGILADVRKRGDAALLEYTRRFDRLELSSGAQLEIPPQRLTQALARISDEQREALEAAAGRLRRYAEHQRGESWSYQEADGTVLGQAVRPLDRAGVYVPGGKAAYPSTVLMNVVPAKVAGVGEIIMCVPAPDGRLEDMVLAAASVAGVDRVFMLGGAQAVAAMAWGTETVPAVDKITGPGNRYVAAAKRLVYGVVGIDMIAGPSEILVVCDGQTDPRWIALDMFAQSEHDEDAQALLVSPDAAFIDRVLEAVHQLLPEMPRAEIIRASLEDRGAVVEVRDLDEAADIVNRVAPEHLELSMAEPEAFLTRVRHAGAVFMGRYSAEVVGDYCAGPNHVLPTARTARFSSPLGVYDFQKRSSIIHCSREGAAGLGRVAATLARAEGLEAHARSAECRMDGDNE